MNSMLELALRSVDLNVNLNALQPMGLILIGALAIIRISADGFKIAIKGDGMHGIFAALILSLFIISSTHFIIQGGQENILTTFVTDMTDKAAASALGGNDLYSTIKFETATKKINAVIQSKMDVVNQDINITNFPVVIMQNISFYMIAGIAYLLTLVNQVVMVTVLIIIKMLIKIPLMIMPLFLPWVVLPKTKQIALNWFSFFLECVIAKLIVAVLFAVTIEVLVAVADKFSASGSVDMISLIVTIMAVQGAMIFAFLKIFQIAKQLARFNPS